MTCGGVALVNGSIQTKYLGVSLDVGVYRSEAKGLIMKVFINHASVDADLARKVADALQEAGMEVWYDLHVLPGDNWAAEAGKALEESDAMVILMTHASLLSDHVQRAISYALGKEEYSARVIPVLAASKESLPKYPWILNVFQMIDLTAYPDEQEGIHKIAALLQDADLTPS